MINFPAANRLLNLIIRTRWKRWIFPFLCSIPYFASIIWLISKQQLWIAQILLAPILMTLMLVGITFLLAKLEFRN